MPVAADTVPAAKEKQTGSLLSTSHGSQHQHQMRALRQAAAAPAAVCGAAGRVLRASAPLESLAQQLSEGRRQRSRFVNALAALLHCGAAAVCAGLEMRGCP
jgi:hypothetical protein